MNLPTLIVAVLLAMCLGLALRSIWKGRGRGCSCCARSGAHEGCAAPHGAARACCCGEDERP